MSKKCAISLGVGQKYSQGLKRLCDSLAANNFNGDVFAFDHYPEGCLTHQEIPYGFKPWLFAWAKRKGYEQVLWMDSACVAVKPLGGLFRKLKRQGVILPYSPHRVWEWCSDACAEKMGVSHEKLRGLCPSMWACVMAMDFRHEKAVSFLARWLDYAGDGVSFHGAWTNDNGEVSADPDVKGHRHDQTVACILAFRMGVPFDWGIVEYDVQNIMPLEGYESMLHLPHFPAYILSNHNVKSRPHAD